MNPVSLRRFPFPFRAALAVTSDIDRCTPEAFRAIHEFLNGELGLDVGDSFWFYANNPHADSFSYFHGITETPGPHADLIRDGLRKGWIDSLHTYGDFAFRGGFHRGLAERALSELKTLGAPLSVWINHGNPFHELGGMGHPRRLGDVPTLQGMSGEPLRTLEYHADLTVAAGFRFLWTGARTLELTEVVGQDRPCPLSEYYLQGPSWNARRLAAWALAFARQERAVRALDVIPLVSNDLISPLRLADGQLVYAFRRYGDYRRDGPEDVPALLSPAVLDRLEAVEGAMSFFTHLGKPRSPRSRPLLPAEEQAFRELARRQASGRIWVARTSRLLRHAMLRRSLVWKAEPGRIRIEAVDDPVFGRFLPEPSDLATLSFSVDDPGTALTLGDRPLAVVRQDGHVTPAGGYLETR